MKVGVVSVAFFSEVFSKVLIGSFRKYYPHVPLIIIDNNLNVEVGVKETKYLSTVDNIIYRKNRLDGKGQRKLNVGLDLAVSYLRKNGFDLMITVDIDSLFLKQGAVESCVDHLVDDFDCGGVKSKNGEYVHPSFAFYSVPFMKGKTFIDGMDTGVSISKSAESVVFMDKVDSIRDYVYHFGGGSVKRGENSWGHRKYRDPVTGLKLIQQYEDKLKTFLAREDVKCYL